MAETLGFMIVLLIFLGNLSLTGSKEANVTCIIQDDCILPCSFRPTGTVVIHWYKQQIPVHSYYYHKDQFGLQNKHFSGRTSLFNSQITAGNASLLLRRVKVQDKGRYKCYTSTRKGNQEIFVNLEVKALIQSVNIEMTDEMVSCSSHHIYPAPQVAWATDPPSAREVLENSTIKTTDHKGLFTMESTLRILGNISDYAYFCSFISADKTQVWTASRKNQDDMAEEEGRKLSISCIAPNTLQNFSLTWTFARSDEPTVILRYDTRTKHTFNLWEGQAELDQDLLLLGNGSLLLLDPDSEEHTGTYTCTFSGLQSRHTVQTRVNITAAPISVDEQSMERSWWSTAASVAFVMLTVFMALPQCLRQRDTSVETRTASHRYNGAGLDEGGRGEELNTTASLIPVQHEGNRPQQEFQTQDELGGDVSKIAENCPAGSAAGINTEQSEGRAGTPVQQNDGLQSCGPESDEAGSNAPKLHAQGIYEQDLEALTLPVHKRETTEEQTVEDDPQELLISVQTEKSDRSSSRDSFKLDWLGEDAHCQDLPISNTSYAVETTISVESEY